MPTFKEELAANGAYLQEKLENVEQFVRGLAAVMLPCFGEQNSAWEIANRICDSYCLPKLV